MWKSIADAREKQYGQFSTKDSMLTKKLNHLTSVISDLEKVRNNSEKHNSIDQQIYEKY